MKILILKRDKLGDMLLTTPMLSVLRATFPNAQIDVLANTYNAWILDKNPDISKVWVYQRVKEGGKIYWGAVWPQLMQTMRLRREQYDWVIVANGDTSHRAIKRAIWIGGKRLVSYVAAGSQSRHVTDGVAPLNSGHEASKMIHLLTPMGITEISTIPVMKFRLPEAAALFAQDWLKSQGLDAGKYITLGLGARRAKKQPTTEQILRWTRHFYDAWGLKTVFMWTPGKSDNPLYPGDDDVAQPVLDENCPWIIPFRGPLKPALGLIWSGSTSIFPDSGLMHFAAASPGGVLGFFAETDVSPSPEQWGPLGPSSRYLEAPKSVSQLSDDAVLNAVQSLLSKLHGK